jgi:UDP-glucose 4-epimerase
MSRAIPRLVITGALGQVGSALLQRMPPGEIGEVVLIDNLSRPPRRPVAGLSVLRRCTMIEADVVTADLERLFGGAPTIIHLAGVTNADTHPSSEADLEHANFEGAARVAEACVRLGCRLFVPSSTSVYGAADGEVDESSPIADLPARNLYAATKFRIERMLAMQASRGLRYAVARFGTIYGDAPGARFDTAVNKFCWQASIGQPLTVWRTAMDQVRPYLAIDDAVRAVRFIVDHDLFEGHVYNVLSQNASVRDVIAGIHEVLPDARVAMVDSPLMNTASFSVSSRRLQQLGFECHGDLRAGIREVLASLGHRQAVRHAE